MLWFVIVLLIGVASPAPHRVGAVSSIHTLLHMDSCLSVNKTLTSCLQTNNCSGRGKLEPCTLVVSLPAKENEVFHESLTRPSMLEVWTIGCLSVALVSLSGIVGAVLWPAINSPLYKHMMRFLIGLAVGSLTATALFQLIPEGFMLRDNDVEMTFLYTALFAWLSIWSIFFIEGISKIIFHKNENERIKAGINGHPLNAIERNSLISHKADKEHSHCHVTTGVATVAWMIILGDGIHNFIDGMSIGAGYTQSIATGIGLSLGIAAEEFPHELGDFAILVQSGMSVVRALSYNFLSACTAFLGFGVGVFVGNIEGAHFVFAFAAGLFLYISLAHLIPELKTMLQEDLKKGRTAGLVTLLLQNAGILFGTVLIFFITKYNDDITNIFPS